MFKTSQASDLGSISVYTSAFLDTNPADNPITSGLLVTQAEAAIAIAISFHKRRFATFRG
jgi:hypothetical protein